MIAFARDYGLYSVCGLYITESNAIQVITGITLSDLQECRIINKIATNAKDCRYRQLPSHLQNLHLLRYTFLTVKYTKHKVMTRIESEG